jgi:hypothetical protein
MPGNEEQTDTGQKLGEANESQVERAMGNRIDLPGDRDRLHLQASHHEPASKKKKRETRVSESDSLRK